MGFEQIGIEAVIQGMQPFVAAGNLYNATIGGMARATTRAANQIVIGFERAIGREAFRMLRQAAGEVLRFAESIISAGLKGSEFERTLGSLKDSLVAVTQTSFAPFFDQLSGLVAKATPGFLGLMQAAETYLGGIATNALTWGENIVTQLANGIINGAVAVINALADLASQIAYWLSPGSPPRLLPDLDTWGTGAAEAYLSGWGKADFGVFDELSSSIEASLRAQAGKNDTGLIPSILGSREAIASAVEAVRKAGTVTQATLDGVFAAIGPATQAMQDYVAATLRLELADKAVSDLEMQFNSLSDAQQQLINEGTISQLELVAGDPNATKREKELARLEIEKLKLGGKMSAAKAEQAAAQNAFDNAKARVQIETDTNSLLKEQVSLLDQLAKATAATAATAKAGGGGKGIFPLIKPDMSWLDDLKTKLSVLTGPLENLKTAWLDVWDKLTAATQGFRDFIVAAIGIQLPTILGNLGISLLLLQGIWDRHKNEIILIVKALAFGVQFAFEAIVTAVISAMTIASGVIALTLSTIAGVWDAITLALQGNWTSMWAVIQTTNAANTAILTYTFGTVFKGILYLFGLDVESLGTLFLNVMTGIAASVAGLVTVFVASFNTIKGYLAGLVPEFVQIGRDLAGGLAAGILAMAGGIAAAAAQIVADAIAAARAALGNPNSPSPVTIKLLGEPFGQGIAAGILDAIGGVQTAAGLAVSAGIGSAAGAMGLASGATTNYSRTNVYNLGGVTTNRSTDSITREFATLQVMAGA